jgi:hypothetical protein
LNLALVGALGERDTKGLASLLQDRGGERREAWVYLTAVDIQGIESTESIGREEVCASAKQELADGEAVRTCSEPQSGVMLISGVGVRSVVEKHSDNCNMA